MDRIKRTQKRCHCCLVARSSMRAGADKTPLHLAAAAGNAEVVALLLAHGATVNARNSDGQTPLQEMQASSLDPALKKNVATVLQAKPKPQAGAAVPHSLGFSVPHGFGSSNSTSNAGLLGRGRDRPIGYPGKSWHRRCNPGRCC
jgi:hypothetical protein